MGNSRPRSSRSGRGRGRGRTGGSRCGGGSRDLGRAAASISNSSVDGTRLDVNTAEVPILRRGGVDDTENTNVEIGRVGRGRSGLVGNNALQGVATCGEPETNSRRRELEKRREGARVRSTINKDRRQHAYVDIICKVEPGVSGEGCAPLLLTTNHPNKVGLGVTDTVFELHNNFAAVSPGLSAIC